MAGKELRKLKRRELLEMLLVQCEETERLQKELEILTEQHNEMSESYERLKRKLNVKDERLNQKDIKIAELNSMIRKMQESRVIELEEAGSIAEAALRLNGIFETAQRCADQYLMNIRRLGEQQPAAGTKTTEEESEKAQKEQEERTEQTERTERTEQTEEREQENREPEEKPAERSEEKVKKQNQIPFESGARSEIRRKQGIVHLPRRTLQLMGAKNAGKTGYSVSRASSGERHG